MVSDRGTGLRGAHRAASRSHSCRTRRCCSRSGGGCSLLWPGGGTRRRPRGFHARPRRMGLGRAGRRRHGRKQV